MTPASRNLAISAPISFSVRESVAVTAAPRAAQNRDVATPVRASPTTSTRLPRNSIAFPTEHSLRRGARQFVPLRFLFLSQLQSRQRKEREDQRRDPKAHDHLGFAPAHQFKMMMDRRHTEDALATQFERAHLQNYRQSFEHKNSAHEKEEDFLLDDDGDYSHRSAERKRAYIPHEEFSG